jgi:voltage-gated potassium channel
MDFVLDFIRVYFEDLFRLGPVLAVVIGAIIALGLSIGKLEKWTPINAIYFAFITATSVGYGDFVPTKHRSKLLAIMVSLTGVLLVGLIVSAGLHALTHAAEMARIRALPGM